MPKVPDQRVFGPQHYNAIAKDIRTELTTILSSDYTTAQRLPAAKVIYDLALKFADRFAIDNYEFDPYKFLNQCSPDSDRLPLAELWR